MFRLESFAVRSDIFQDPGYYHVKIHIGVGEFTLSPNYPAVHLPAQSVMINGDLLIILSVITRALRGR